MYSGRVLAFVACFVGFACDRLGPEGREWELVQSLAILTPLVAPLDRSNQFDGDARAEGLGQAFYFDPDFSGNSTLIDMLGRPVFTPPGRAPKGERTGISCVSCHDPARGGTDHTSNAQVSIGAGAYDVASQPTVNSAFNDLWYWNGRNDSLWSQIIAVDESPVSMGGNRLRTMWRVADAYRERFEAVAGPLPVAGTLAEHKALLLPDRSCRLEQGACPAPACAVDTATVAGQPSCWPRFPLEGRPGAKMGCQRGDSTEPFGDAFDCMAAADRDLVTGVYVSWAKIIATYERTLLSQDSAFDRWVKKRRDDAVESDLISDAAQRGLRLFIGKASCIECHNTKLFTDLAFHDISVPQEGQFIPTEDQCPAGSARCDCVAGKSCLPWGLFDGLKKLQGNGFRRDSKWSADPTDDSRAAHYTLDLSSPAGEATKRRWKTPSLRDVAITGPYMHNGRYATLRDVLEHYNWGGHLGRDVRDPKVVALGLSDQDLDDLAAFLLTLTGAPMPLGHVTAPVLPPASVF